MQGRSREGLREERRLQAIQLGAREVVVVVAVTRTKPEVGRLGVGRQFIGRALIGAAQERVQVDELHADGGGRGNRRGSGHAADQDVDVRGAGPDDVVDEQIDVAREPRVVVDDPHRGPFPELGDGEREAMEQRPRHRDALAVGDLSFVDAHVRGYTALRLHAGRPDDEAERSAMRYDLVEPIGGAVLKKHDVEPVDARVAAEPGQPVHEGLRSLGHVAVHDRADDERQRVGGARDRARPPEHVPCRRWRFPGEQFARALFRHRPQLPRSCGSRAWRRTCRCRRASPRTPGPRDERRRAGCRDARHLHSQRRTWPRGRSSGCRGPDRCSSRGFIEAARFEQRGQADAQV